MTVKSQSPITLMFVSDIHLGSPLLNLEKLRNHFDSDADTSKGLPHFLTRNKYSYKVNKTFILGDIFDRPISIDEPHYSTIKEIFFDLVEDLGLPILLKGTTSHDGTYQIPNLIDEKYRENLASDPECMRSLDEEDYYPVGDYISSIYVTTYKWKPQDGKGKRTISVGYIPDNMCGTKEEIIETLKKCMEKKKLKEIDYLLTHVLWDFHVDPSRIRPDIPVFSESDFPFVKKHIVSGHIHQHQERGKLVICGSATRTRFEETDTKGITLIHDYGDHTSVEFVPLPKSHDLHVLLYKPEETSKIQEVLQKDDSDIVVVLEEESGTVPEDYLVPLRNKFHHVKVMTIPLYLKDKIHSLLPHL